MQYKKYSTDYNKFPTVKFKPEFMLEHTDTIKSSSIQDEYYDGTQAIKKPYAWKGNEVWQVIVEAQKDIRTKCVVIDCYPGVDGAYIESCFKEQCEKSLIQCNCINVESALHSPEHIDKFIAYNLTEDRVFGILSHFKIWDFYDAEKIMALHEHVKAFINTDALLLLYGTGADYVATQMNIQDKILVYADMPRWEIQMRMRKGMSNWATHNPDEDMLRKYKRGYFIEWRTADNHKKNVYHNVDFFLDTTVRETPKLVEGAVMREALTQVVQQPFRVKPFFDPGVWGGQWMKEVCNLDLDKENYAWCFDGVPEENSLLIEFDSVCIEIPSINVVFFQPRALLGDSVHSRFGTEFPIRFDFLDTMGGQHLSLQVHPLVEYVQEHFGMHYTQDESYYMLDTEDDACVYLGLKAGVKPKDFIDALEKAQKGDEPLQDELYVNSFPAKTHDHFLIPAGTVHCSGKNSMVLEISATPYIFTFKLWDWGRVGLDGRPRPVHIEHGKKVIQWDRDTQWVKDNLINRVVDVAHGDGWREESTGLHEREFIETRRHWFTKKVSHDTGYVEGKNSGTVHMLNLVQGEEAIVESPTELFEPFVVHFAETFIIPAAVGKYTVCPYGKAVGTECATMKAYVRG